MVASITPLIISFTVSRCMADPASEIHSNFQTCPKLPKNPQKQYEGERMVESIDSIHSSRQRSADHPAGDMKTDDQYDPPQQGYSHVPSQASRSATQHMTH